MSARDPVAARSELTTLCERFASGQVDRRGFMRAAAALGVAGAASAVLPQLSAGIEAAGLAQQTAATTPKLPLDVAEWSYMWVNVKRAETARSTFIGGQQMYVEYMIPSQVKHPFPIVLVHGGGGQGTDWMGTPDGRPGWFQYLVAEGFKVYVVDRPGHGRSPLHPDLHGGFPPTAAVLENIAGRFTPPSANPAATPNEYQKHATQWPGPGNVGSPDLDQLVAGEGGSYVVPSPAGAPAAGRQGGAAQGGSAPGATRGGTPTPANALPAGPLNAQHMVWRQAGADLLDKIGPAIIVTHSAGGPFGLLVAEARPTLVKATVIIEGAGSGFAGGNRWGMSSIPVTYDPPVADAAEIKTHWVSSPEPGINGYFLQMEPAHKLPNLRNTKVVFVTADSSFASPGNPGGVAFLKQAGVPAEELRLGTVGIHGNGHMMMVEKNSRNVLQPILDWMMKNVNGSNSQSPPPRRGSGDSLALKLADANIFWVGTDKKTMPYGTIHVGQMFVQYLEPAEVRHPVPVLLVHGGGGQMVHYMGLGGASGWAHHFLQAGYKVYLVDRPGHGRSPYHPDALGEIGPLVTYDLLTRDTVTSARMPNKQWPGTTGDVGDPLVDQLMAAANSAMRDNQLAQTLWRTHGAELVDRIGPTIVVTHSAGGPFGWLVANERPTLVKAVVSFEGATAPLVGQGGAAGTPLPNLKGMPIMYLLSERGGRNAGPILNALMQSGARAEAINLKDRGILGNSHFAMFENNRRQVFDVIRTWIEQRVPAGTSTARLE